MRQNKAETRNFPHGYPGPFAPWLTVCNVVLVFPPSVRSVAFTSPDTSVFRSEPLKGWRSLSELDLSTCHHIPQLSYPVPCPHLSPHTSISDKRVLQPTQRHVFSQLSGSQHLLFWGLPLPVWFSVNVLLSSQDCWQALFLSEDFPPCSVSQCPPFKAAPAPRPHSHWRALRVAPYFLMDGPISSRLVLLEGGIYTSRICVFPQPVL